MADVFTELSSFPAPFEEELAGFINNAGNETDFFFTNFAEVEPSFQLSSVANATCLVTKNTTRL